ncbi:MAG: PD-(D/E)XK nuclease family protein [candidate division KSB1 bacterium]|nr:PD-(D/E)XK nuclease family protein [candidate division KSB1 bacterium]MDZ7275570.1 PD-(D/E)XK nuclease family protein [candidate division KSB1 bacterium]MDZ7286118.1 PD-(D/E)XK nuclease family protein [candidate division KSB1 bacterium]MDZ7296344.1 PD-(D/E)XK nuclease family protein [candidate division KSB1 bacterium]MDZ7347211.1 PD-(D/E)XK nuclease family protein [candidate division KSB1 bacterium]
MTFHRDDIESRILEFFEENFEMLRMESGHSLSPDAKRAAQLQVLFYWRRLREVAEKVTDTEVRLSLPEQKTRKGRRFGIEGVVDLVRERERTVMYDIKTHDAEAVHSNTEEYLRQLNVYAHIWQNLNKQRLDETAIISTAFPEAVREALNKTEEELEAELQKWEPLIPLPFDAASVQETIARFGEIVDKIEEGEFAPPPVDKLKRKQPGMKAIFAVQTCRNCDARFSCSAYRAYAQSSRGTAESTFRQLFFDDFGTEEERNERVMAGLEGTPIEIEE